MTQPSAEANSASAPADRPRVELSHAVANLIAGQSE